MTAGPWADRFVGSRHTGPSWGHVACCVRIIGAFRESYGVVAPRSRGSHCHRHSARRRASSSWWRPRPISRARPPFWSPGVCSNFFWLALLRRPASAALVSLAMVVTLILLSQFKYDKLMMTVNFVDVMILDPDTVAFFLTIYPDLLRRVNRLPRWWQFRRSPCSGGSIPTASGCASPPPAAVSALPAARRAFRSPVRWSRTRPSPATATSRNSSIPASMPSSPTLTQGYLEVGRELSPANSASRPPAPASRPPSRRTSS